MFRWIANRDNRNTGICFKWATGGKSPIVQFDYRGGGWVRTMHARHKHKLTRTHNRTKIYAQSKGK